jgi:hypothetical protein
MGEIMIPHLRLYFYYKAFDALIGYLSFLFWKLPADILYIYFCIGVFVFLMITQTS